MFLYQGNKISIKDIEFLSKESILFENYKNAFIGNQMDFVFPKKIISLNDKRIYRTGFYRMALDCFFYNEKKSTINNMLRNQYDVIKSNRSIDRNVIAFKKLINY